MQIKVTIRDQLILASVAIIKKQKVNIGKDVEKLEDCTLLVPIQNWHLPSASARIKSHAAAVPDLQHP